MTARRRVTPLAGPMGLGRFELPTSRLSANLTEDANHGKKSYKFNQDCAICRSCRKAMIGSIVPKWRTNRVEWQTFGGPLALPFTWGTGAMA